MSHLYQNALFAATLVCLAGCSLTRDEPLEPGTFEVTVTGDAEARATGTAFVAAPDSSRNGPGAPWVVQIQVVLESSVARADGGAEVFLSVIEPREPNGSFTQLPEGTLVVDKNGGRFASQTLVSSVVRTARLDLSPTDGTLELRRVADGVVGTLHARYVEGRLNGQVFRGRIDLRFYALGTAPGEPR